MIAASRADPTLREGEARPRVPPCHRVPQEGEALTIWLARRDEDLAGELPPLRVLHEDPWLIAVDKPAGLLAHPVRFDRRVSVVTLVRSRFEAEGSDVRPTLSHRLDRETSGVLLLAKDARTDRLVKRAFETRQVEKSYLAVVRGAPDWEELDLDAPVGKAPDSEIGLKQAVVRGGQPARTRFRVEERARGCALVRAWPHTGRMHQIRVHLDHLGLPLVGDKVYGRPAACFLDFLERGLSDEWLSELELPRHALHAARIALRHPETGEPLALESPLPAELRSYLDGRTEIAAP